jgi:hypothetical protein
MGAGGMFGPAPHIPRPEHPTIDESPVILSFKYLDLESNPKFDRDRCRNIEFLTSFLAELYQICQGRVCDLAEYANRRHNHLIDFSNTTEPNGFNLPEQIEPEVCWQFAVSEDHAWRVHGFFISSVFYVVWLDPEH